MESAWAAYCNYQKKEWRWLPSTARGRRQQKAGALQRYSVSVTHLTNVQSRQQTDATCQWMKLSLALVLLKKYISKSIIIYRSLCMFHLSDYSKKEKKKNITAAVLTSHSLMLLNACFLPYEVISQKAINTCHDIDNKALWKLLLLLHRTFISQVNKHLYWGYKPHTDLDYFPFCSNRKERST